VGESALAGLAAVVVVLMLLGLARVTRGPGPADRLLGVQLIGTLSIALLLLLGEALRAPIARDVALVLAVLGAITAAVFTRRI
jgi:multicomponent Na+:H+ antiporter subunit F